MSDKRAETQFGGPRGNPINTKGRPQHARQRVTATFLEALADDFDKHGADAIAQCRKDDPATYVKVCASLCPKEVDANLNFSLADALRAIASGVRPAPALEQQSAGLRDGGVAGHA